ncbi:2-succinyl-5-enolpyruvyl-6-hydroxy-3-cyclohexene-1-carboxylic-acid synthase [Nocardioides caldifontis]|uniref:2-succinyl-5-enolpyruvyl-6-hydroxy-3- cyclohexene-1-carboxylic-acid synthase n=1 Tax=Nocardioides caldifontis TaxID=2588938 RepID=UPI001EF0687A|nr:2-succinyl-5-enolpyruvyl-6-hydroxy-3-cyclohexene-1-carboxylic-acid synthase [Nocardioides caldifontis]
MTDPGSAVPANAATALATTVVDELVRGGVAHVVLSPGSRSAALAFAVHDAAAAGRLTLHTRIDERTAGFLALGIARTSRRPVAVVTTSGTAVANLHPAVLEASHAGVPIVLVTADRPASLRGTGANQTTDQVKLFGGAVRAFADVPAGAPGVREEPQLRGWRGLVARALAAATAVGSRGPVHLNLQFDGPLVPDVTDGWSTPVAGRPDDRPWTATPEAAAADGWEGLVDDSRTVVVAGDDAGPPARVLAEVGGWPLLAEPTSGSRTGTHAIRTYRLLLGTDLADRVDRVVVCGHPTLSRPVTRLLSRADVEVVAAVAPGAASRGWTDPGHAVSRVVELAPPSEPAERRVTPWFEEWRERDAEVGGRLDALLDGWAPLTPHHVAGAVARALPAGGLLHVGASNPVRDLDLMVPRYDVGDRRMVVANRGLAGIDGTVSSAVGAALGRPYSTRSLALLGDVTFVHDTTGLVLGPEEQRPPLTLVVVNDDGGSIFAVLEQGADAHAASFDRLFGTPHGVDLAALCAATGTPHTRVTDRDALDQVLATPPSAIEVVEAVVRRDDRRRLDEAVRELARP